MWGVRREEKLDLLQNSASKFLNGDQPIDLTSHTFPPRDSSGGGWHYRRSHGHEFRLQPTHLEAGNPRWGHSHIPQRRESSWVIATWFGERPGKVKTTALTLILTAMVTLVHIYPACSHIRQSYNEMTHFRHFWTSALRLCVLSELLSYSWFRLNQTHKVQDS